jgi:hypothetical protein
VIGLNAAEAAAKLQLFATVNNRIPMLITVEDRLLRADFAPKAARKVLAAVREHGPEGVAVLIQGKLGPNNQVIDAGRVAQPKQPKAAERSL